MRRYVNLVLTALAAIIAAVFAVSNRQAADIAFWPLPDHLSLPLYIAVLGPAFLGVLVGRVSFWPKHQRLKTTHRRSVKRLENLQAGQIPVQAGGTPPKPANKSLAA